MDTSSRVRIVPFDAIDPAALKLSQGSGGSDLLLCVRGLPDMMSTSEGGTGVIEKWMVQRRL